MERMDGGLPGAGPNEALRLVTRILMSGRELERRFDHCLNSHGVNLTRADVLTSVARYGKDGCSQTDLANALRLSESNICTLVERMRADGWLFRMRSGTDRRKSIIVLSPRGLDSLRQVEQVRQTRAAEWLRGLSSAELKDLNVLLDRLLVALADTNLPVAEELKAHVHTAPVAFESLRRAS